MGVGIAVLCRFKVGGDGVDLVQSPIDGPVESRRIPMVFDEVVRARASVRDADPFQLVEVPSPMGVQWQSNQCH